MSQTLSNEQHTFKRKKLITVLSLIALICAVLGFARNFLLETYTLSDDGKTYELISTLASVFTSGIIDGINYLISEMIFPIFSLAFVLYFLKFYKYFKAKFIVFPFLLVNAIITIISSINTVLKYTNTDNTMFDPKSVTLVIIRSTVFSVIFVVAVTLAIIGSFKGFSNKAFIIVAVVTKIIDNSLSLISNFVPFIHYGLDKYFFYYTVVSLSYVALWLALLLFELSNNMLIFTKKAVNKAIKKMKPEQALKFLSHSHNAGQITEEEYTVLRAEIISKL